MNIRRPLVNFAPGEQSNESFADSLARRYGPGLKSVTWIQGGPDGPTDEQWAEGLRHLRLDPAAMVTLGDSMAETFTAERKAEDDKRAAMHAEMHEILARVRKLFTAMTDLIPDDESEKWSEISIEKEDELLALTMLCERAIYRRE